MVVGGETGQHTHKHTRTCGAKIAFRGEMINLFMMFEAVRSSPKFISCSDVRFFGFIINFYSFRVIRFGKRRVWVSPQPVPTCINYNGTTQRRVCVVWLYVCDRFFAPQGSVDFSIYQNVPHVEPEVHSNTHTHTDSHTIDTITHNRTGKSTFNDRTIKRCKRARGRLSSACECVRYKIAIGGHFRYSHTQRVVKRAIYDTRLAVGKSVD